MSLFVCRTLSSLIGSVVSFPIYLFFDRCFAIDNVCKLFSIVTNELLGSSWSSFLLVFISFICFKFSNIYGMIDSLIFPVSCRVMNIANKCLNFRRNLKNKIVPALMSIIIDFEKTGKILSGITKIRIRKLFLKKTQKIFSGSLVSNLN